MKYELNPEKGDLISCAIVKVQLLSVPNVTGNQMKLVEMVVAHAGVMGG
jgi:hypothetical protein